MNTTKLQETRGLLYEHAKEITQDAAHWMDFLDTASRVYRYSFPDAVLIHAQRPDASAVATYDIWSGSMHRYVKRGTKGIALLEDLNDRPRLRYVFDISDTGVMRGSKSPVYWQISDDMQDDMRDYLIDTYGLDADGVPDLMTALMHISFDVGDEHYQDVSGMVQERMTWGMADHISEKPKENEIGSHVAMLLTNSIVYILTRRCGLNPKSVVSAEDFDRWLTGFQNFDLIDAVGQIIMEQSSLILHDIYRTTVTLTREKEKKALDRTIKKSYSTDKKNMKREGTQTQREPQMSDVSSPPERDEAETKHEYQNQSQKQIQGGQGHGDSVHSEGRLSLSEPDSDGGTGRAGGTRQIRRDAPEVSEGEPLRGVPQHVVPGSPETALRPDQRAGLGETGNPGEGTDETIPRSGPGSEQRHPGLRSVEEYDHASVGGEHPDGIGIHAVEDSEENSEEDKKEIPEVPEETPPGLTLPELPPMEEQIRQLEKPEASSYADNLPFSEEVIDEFLRCAGHQKNSNLRIIYNFMVSQTFKAHVEFVRNEFAGTRRQEFVCRRGLYIDGVPYSARWDAEGILIVAGKSEAGKERIRLTWGDVVKRIDQLLLAGRYAPQDDLDRARENAVAEHAELLRMFYRDLTEEGKNLFAHVEKNILTGSATPSGTDPILDRMKSPEFLEHLILDLETVAAAYEQNPSSIYSWNSSFYRPDLVLERFRIFQKPALTFLADPKFEWKQSKAFISQETMDDALRHNTMKDSRFRILSFFLSHRDTKQRADFLKNEFGQGGWTGPDSCYTDYDGKGIRVKTAILSNEMEDVFSYTWSKAAERVATLIDQGTWLSGIEHARIFSYERDVLAENVLNFYLNAQELGIASIYAPEKTWTYAWEMPADVMDKKKKNFTEIFADFHQAEQLYHDMERVLAEMPLAAGNFETCRETVKKMSLLLEGRYTLFPGLERIVQTDTLEVRAAQRNDADAEEEPAEKRTDEADAHVEEKWGKEEAEIKSAESSDEPGANSQNVIQKQDDKKRRRSGSKRQSKQTDNRKKTRRSSDSDSNGEGQQMSLFDFLGDEEGNFIFQREEEEPQKERLSDNVYFYDHKTRSVQLAYDADAALQKYQSQTNARNYRAAQQTPKRGR